MKKMKFSGFTKITQPHTGEMGLESKSVPKAPAVHYGTARPLSYGALHLLKA